MQNRSWKFLPWQIKTPVSAGCAQTSCKKNGRQVKFCLINSVSSVTKWSCFWRCLPLNQLKQMTTSKILSSGKNILSGNIDFDFKIDHLLHNRFFNQKKLRVWRCFKSLEQWHHLFQDKNQWRSQYKRFSLKLTGHCRAGRQMLDQRLFSERVGLFQQSKLLKPRFSELQVIAFAPLIRVIFFSSNNLNQGMFFYVRDTFVNVQLIIWFSRSCKPFYGNWEAATEMQPTYEERYNSVQLLYIFRIRLTIVEWTHKIHPWFIDGNAISHSMIITCFLELNG